MSRCTVSSEEEKDCNIDKIFHELNVNKRLCLIHEFCFGTAPDSFYIREADYPDLTSVLKKIQKINRILQKKIPANIRERCKYEDYFYFTADTYGHRHWNEIPLPLVTKQLCSLSLNQFNQGKEQNYCISLYDMSGEELYFSTESEMKQFCLNHRTGPVTAFHLLKQSKTELFSYYL